MPTKNQCSKEQVSFNNEFKDVKDVIIGVTEINVEKAV